MLVEHKATRLIHRRGARLMVDALQSWIKTRLKDALSDWKWCTKTIKRERRKTMARLEARLTGSATIARVQAKLNARFNLERKKRGMRLWKRFVLIHREEERNEAAKAIQTQYRQYLYRKKFLINLHNFFLDIKASRIQAAWKGLLDRRVADKMRKEREILRINCAATKIESLWKSVFQYRIYKHIRNQVIIIQCHIRRFVERRRFLNILNSTIVIQRIWRGYCARVCAYQQRMARRIQCAWRRMIARRNFAAMMEQYRKENAAALLVQMHFYKSRGLFPTFVLLRTLHYVEGISRAEERREKDKRRSAAISIQRAWRQMMFRWESGRELRAAVIIQRIYRGYCTRIEWKTTLHVRCTIAILMCGIYGHTSVFDVFDLRYNARVIIQRVVRGWMGRLFVRRMKQGIFMRRYAATRIQKWWKQEFAHRLWAIRLVQRAWFHSHPNERMKRAQRVREMIRDARRHASAITIQSCIRCFLAKNKLKRLQWEHKVILPTLRIQRWWKLWWRFEQRKRLWQIQTKAATCIQTMMRGYTARMQTKKWRQLIQERDCNRFASTLPTVSAVTTAAWQLLCNIWHPEDVRVGLRIPIATFLLGLDFLKPQSPYSSSIGYLLVSEGVRSLEEVARLGDEGLRQRGIRSVPTRRVLLDLADDMESIRQDLVCISTEQEMLDIFLSFFPSSPLYAQSVSSSAPLCIFSRYWVKAVIEMNENAPRKARDTLLELFSTIPQSLKHPIPPTAESNVKETLSHKHSNMPQHKQRVESEYKRRLSVLSKLLPNFPSEDFRWNAYRLFAAWEILHDAASRLELIVGELSEKDVWQALKRNRHKTYLSSGPLVEEIRSVIKDAENQERVEDGLLRLWRLLEDVQAMDDCARSLQRIYRGRLARKMMLLAREQRFRRKMKQEYLNFREMEKLRVTLAWREEQERRKREWRAYIDAMQGEAWDRLRLGPLRFGWQELIDESSSLVYYLESSTYKSVWEKPYYTWEENKCARVLQRLFRGRIARRRLADLRIYVANWEKRQQKNAHLIKDYVCEVWANRPPKYRNPDYLVRVSTNCTSRGKICVSLAYHVPPLPCGWQKIQDGSTEKWFYFHEKSGQVTWSRPYLTQDEYLAALTLQRIGRGFVARLHTRQLKKQVHIGETLARAIEQASKVGVWTGYGHEGLTLSSYLSWLGLSRHYNAVREAGFTNPQELWNQSKFVLQSMLLGVFEAARTKLIRNAKAPIPLPDTVPLMNVDSDRQLIIDAFLAEFPNQHRRAKDFVESLPLRPQRSLTLDFDHDWFGVALSDPLYDALVPVTLARVKEFLHRYQGKSRNAISDSSRLSCSIWECFHRLSLPTDLATRFLEYGIDNVDTLINAPDSILTSGGMIKQEHREQWRYWASGNEEKKREYMFVLNEQQLRQEFVEAFVQVSESDSDAFVSSLQPTLLCPERLCPLDPPGAVLTIAHLKHLFSKNRNRPKQARIAAEKLGQSFLDMPKDGELTRQENALLQVCELYDRALTRISFALYKRVDKNDQDRLRKLVKFVRAQITKMGFTQSFSSNKQEFLYECNSTRPLPQTWRIARLRQLVTTMRGTMQPWIVADNAIRTIQRVYRGHLGRKRWKQLSMLVAWMKRSIMSDIVDAAAQLAEDLAIEWEQYWDKSRNRYYYFNRRTGKTVWKLASPDIKFKLAPEYHDHDVFNGGPLEATEVSDSSNFWSWKAMLSMLGLEIDNGLCQRCHHSEVTHLCEECDEMWALCLACFVQEHDTPHTSRHSYMVIDPEYFPSPRANSDSKQILLYQRLGALRQARKGILKSACKVSHPILNCQVKGCERVGVRRCIDCEFRRPVVLWYVIEDIYLFFFS